MQLARQAALAGKMPALPGLLHYLIYRFIKYKYEQFTGKARFLAYAKSNVYWTYFKHTKAFKKYSSFC